MLDLYAACGGLGILLGLFITHVPAEHIRNFLRDLRQFVREHPRPETLVRARHRRRYGLPWQFSDAEIERLADPVRRRVIGRHLLKGGTAVVFVSLALQWVARL